MAFEARERLVSEPEETQVHVPITNSAEESTKPSLLSMLLNLQGGRVFALTIALLHVLAGTIIWQHLMTPNTSLGTAFYFAVETFLTIGYGDYTPQTDASKLFFIIYTIFSLIIQLTVVTTFVSATLSLTPAEKEVNEDTQRPKEELASFFSIKPRITKALQGVGLLLVLVTAGAFMIHYGGAKGADTWLDCWYWSVTTISTVGYGDIVPSKFRIVFAFFFLVSVVLFASVLGDSVGLVQEVGCYRRMAKLFEHGICNEVIERMDASNDGQVSKDEFLMFMLEHLGVADRDKMEQIMVLFEACDVNGDGTLDINDAKQRLGSGTLSSTRSDFVRMMSSRRLSSRLSGALSGPMRSSHLPLDPSSLNPDLLR